MKNSFNDPQEWFKTVPALSKSIKKDLKVLGIIGTPASHDSSAAIIVNNQIVAAVEEERFAHIKHVGAYPIASIDYCLKTAGIKFSELDYIAYPFIPERFYKAVVQEPQQQGAVAENALFARTSLVEKIKEITEVLKKHYGTSVAEKFIWVNHHLAHGASAYYASGFDEAVVLSVDGGGDRECASLMYAKNEQIQLTHSYLDYPQSLGRFYDIVTRYVIGNPVHKVKSGKSHTAIVWDAGKLMGLAGYGKVDPDFFKGLIKIDPDNLDQPVSFDMSYFSVHSGDYPFSKKWIERFGPARDSSQNIEQRHFTMAASAQFVLEEAMLAIVKSARLKYPDVKNLCLSGGTALNVHANRRIYDSQLFENIFVAPASNDAGTALGAALYVNTAASSSSDYSYSVYSGPDIEKDYDIEQELLSFGGRICFERLDPTDLCKQVASLLSNNKIIGWCQGRMEFGPRALGNRSLLANPANPLGKEVINTRVKKREHYRPYAPSVLEEECSNWFDINHSPHMLMSAKVQQDKTSCIPSVVHIDGSTRPQTVNRKDNSLYYQLLQEFFKLTGVPVLLNTSLNNHGGTIVNSPVDGVMFLLESEMDALAIGPYLVTRA